MGRCRPAGLPCSCPGRKHQGGGGVCGGRDGGPPAAPRRPQEGLAGQAPLLRGLYHLPCPHDCPQLPLTLTRCPPHLPQQSSALTAQDRGSLSLAPWEAPQAWPPPAELRSYSLSAHTVSRHATTLKSRLQPSGRAPPVCFSPQGTQSTGIY